MLTFSTQSATQNQRPGIFSIGGSDNTPIPGMAQLTQCPEVWYGKLEV